jgi:hypothetical protein
MDLTIRAREGHATAQFSRKYVFADTSSSKRSTARRTLHTHHFGCTLIQLDSVEDELEKLEEGKLAQPNSESILGYSPSSGPPLRDPQLLTKRHCELSRCEIRAARSITATSRRGLREAQAQVAGRPRALLHVEVPRYSTWVR